MSIKIAPARNDIQAHHPVITIIGAGGAGGNAVNNMVKSQVAGVDFVACNTDAQALELSKAPHRIQIGVETTKGLGAGSDPSLGRQAAQENIDLIRRHLQKTQMLFITAGMGGGTGTGAAPVIADLSKEMGILTIAIVTRPFDFEGHRRMKIADQGIKELSEKVDTLIIVPNQKLFKITDKTTTFPEAFKMADDVLCSGVRGISDLMTMPGVINLDFADIRNMMKIRGKAMIGTGQAEGKDRVREAASKAISNPLLDDGLSISAAHGMLVNIIGGPDLTLNEVEEAVNYIRGATHEDRDLPLTFGTSLHEEMSGKVRISILATGIDHREKSDFFKEISDEEQSDKEGDAEKENPSASLKQDAVEGEAQPSPSPLTFLPQEKMPSPTVSQAAPQQIPLQQRTIQNNASTPQPTVPPRKAPEKSTNFLDKVLEKARGKPSSQARTETMAMFDFDDPADENPSASQTHPQPDPQNEEKEQIKPIPSFLAKQEN